MHRLAWVFGSLGLPVLLDALTTARTNPEQELDLLEKAAEPVEALDLLEKKKIEKKKWNWKEASEESKTEWAIVLKRYVFADMILFELRRLFGEALPDPLTTTEARQEALGKARQKAARLQSSFEKAVLDQNTSDTTAGDMQKASKTNLLTAHEKRILAQDHKRERYGFFAVEASGQDVLEKTNELLQALEASQSQSTQKTSPSWSSIVAAPVTPKPTYLSMLNVTKVVPNSTHRNGTAMPQTKPTLGMIFKRFEDACQTFHKDLGTFESMQSKAMTNFLATTAR